MKKTSNTTAKRGRGRPKKTVTETTHREVQQKVGIPALLEPTEYDIRDELVRLDSFAYSRYR